MKLALMVSGSRILHLNWATLLLDLLRSGLTISQLSVLGRTQNTTVACAISCLSITGFGSRLKIKCSRLIMFPLLLCGLMVLQSRLILLPTREYDAVAVGQGLKGPEQGHWSGCTYHLWM